MAVTSSSFTVNQLTLLATGTADQNLSANVKVKTTADTYFGGPVGQNFLLAAADSPLDLYDMWLGDDLYADCTYDPDAVDEVLDLTVDATEGMFTITTRTGFPDAEASSYDFDVDAAVLETGLAAHTGFASVTVTGGPGDDGGTTPYEITFTPLRTGDAGSVTVAPYDTEGTNVLGGTGTAVLTETTPGTDPTANPSTVYVLQTGV